MRVLLHIGTEKTGTTAIQHLLNNNRATLAAMGYHVLRCSGDENHRWVPTVCMRPDRPDDLLDSIGANEPGIRAERTKQFRDEFDRELRGLGADIHTVLITSEHFHSRLLHQDEVDAVRELIAPYTDDVRILCYLRPQVDMCSSFYSTALKSGQTDDFEWNLQQCVPQTPYYDHAGLLTRWSKTFGKGAMQVRVFERQRMYRGNLLDDFCQQIAPELVDAVDTNVGQPNESIVPAAQAIARVVNKIFAEEQQRPVRERTAHILERHLAGKGEQPSPERWRKVQSLFDEGNEQVRREYFPSQDTLFRSGRPEEPESGLGLEFDRALAEVLELVRRN